ncbi:hypothetical protein [Glutamicibacter sp.]|uniref:hypothetical protein n=1 Tax=Glutamicibacter sp. TaxID=1931995 RepID=UPI0028BD7BEF|nr:hypothetical protein [Glutamicibacter sp.]
MCATRGQAGEHTHAGCSTGAARFAGGQLEGWARWCACLADQGTTADGLGIDFTMLALRNVRLLAGTSGEAILVFNLQVRAGGHP